MSEAPLPRNRIAELGKRTLVVVAHPDDECIGAGVMVQRIEEPAVVFCTDGGPRDEFFWQRFGSREQYVHVRRHEATLAGQAVGLDRHTFLPIIDRELYLNLAGAHRALENLVLDFRPHALLTLAYEGGHPDHDCCAFLSHRIGFRHKLPVWEMPLYHRTSEGPRQQQFLNSTEGYCLRVSAPELRRKRQMLSCYESQASVLAGFNLSSESCRPQWSYDFSTAPAEVINYEAWKWPVSAAELCRAFADFKPEI